MKSHTMIAELYKDKQITSEKFCNNIYNCIFENVTYISCTFINCDFHCIMKNVNFSNCVFSDCHFSGSLENIDFIENCLFSSHNTFYNSLVGVNIRFDNADIDNIRFRTVTLSGLYIYNSKIKTITFSESTINKCSFNLTICTNLICSRSIIRNLFFTKSKFGLFEYTSTHIPDYIFDDASSIEKIKTNSISIVKDSDIYGSLLADFLHDCPLIENNTRIVYRSEASLFRTATVYKPGQIYTADLFSWDTMVECGPGIYASSAKWLYANLIEDIRFSPYHGIVRCAVEDGDWIMTLKGAIRTKKLTVLEKFSIEEFEANLQQH